MSKVQQEENKSINQEEEEEEENWSLWLFNDEAYEQYQKYKAEGNKQAMERMYQNNNNFKPSMRR